MLVDQCSTSVSNFDLGITLFEGEGYEGNSLASESFSIPIPFSRNLFPISFSTPANITSGQSYTFMIYPIGPQECFPGGGGSVIGRLFYSNDTYSNGIHYDFYNGGGAPTRDLYFTTTVDTSLGIEDNNLVDNLNLYPNPAKNQFTLDLKNGSTLESISIFTMSGQEVLNASRSIVNTSSLSAGIYLVEIKTNNGKVMKKLIIE